MTYNRYWILDPDGNPTRATMMGWAIWFEDKRKSQIAFDAIEDRRVSTIFLGLEHGVRDGKPILWETFVAGPSYEAVYRHTSREDAVACHEACVRGDFENRSAVEIRCINRLCDDDK